jgi:hypothetical protein
MDKAIIAAAVVLGLSAAASPASAQRFAPASTNAVLEGRLRIDQGWVVDCDVKIRYLVDAAGAAFFINATISDPVDFRCGTVIQPTGAWTLHPTLWGGTPRLSLYVSINTLAGSCSGQIAAPYNAVIGEATVNAAYLFGLPGPCVLDGVLTMDPPLTIAP